MSGHSDESSTHGGHAEYPASAELQQQQQTHETPPSAGADPSGGSIPLHLHGGSFGGLRTSHGAGRPSFPLLAIVFAEFDNTVGPKVTCQAPEGFLAPDLFDSISDLIITGPELCHKLVSVNAGPYTVIGYPMQLSHKKYHRNALLFNVAFVFPREDVGPTDQTQTQTHATATGATASSPSSPLIVGCSSGGGSSSQLRPYHPVIRKLARQLESLEIASEFIFRRSTPEGARALQAVITKIFRSLNAYGECSVAVDTGHKHSGSAQHERHFLPQQQHSAAAIAGVSHVAAFPVPSLPRVSSSPMGAARRLDGGGGGFGGFGAGGHGGGGGGGVSADGRGSAHMHAPGGFLSESEAPCRGDAANQIHLKLYPLLTLPPRQIPPWAVPLRTKDLDRLWKTEWDLTLRQVLPFIDGVNYVSRISTLSGVHAALVAKCVRQLLYYEAVQLVDIFQFSNLYQPCDGLALACMPPTMMTHAGPGATTTTSAAVAAAMASMGGGASSSDVSSSAESVHARFVKLRRDARRVCRADPTRPKPDWTTMVRLWCGLSTAHTIGEYLKNLHVVLPEQQHSQGRGRPSLESLNLHPRKWIQFGLVNGFVRRVHAYPILVSMYAAPSSSLAGGASAQQQQATSASDSTAAHIASLIHGGRVLNNNPAATTTTTAGSGSGGGGGGGGGGSGTSGSFRPRSRQTTDEVDGGTNSNSASSNALHTAQQQSLRSSSASSYHGGVSDLNAPPAPPLAPAYAYTGSSAASAASFRALEKYLDGDHHMDQLCLIAQKSHQQVEDDIRRSRRCIVVYK